jgi:acyl carrier protein
MDSRQIIRNYILENFLSADSRAVIADNASFLAQGIIDSVGTLEIALFIEQQFGFVVGDEEMLPNNLDSVNNLVAFIERKQKESACVQHISLATAAPVAG